MYIYIYVMTLFYLHHLLPINEMIPINGNFKKRLQDGALPAQAEAMAALAMEWPIRGPGAVPFCMYMYIYIYIYIRGLDIISEVFSDLEISPEYMMNLDMEMHPNM